MCHQIINHINGLVENAKINGVQLSQLPWNRGQKWSSNNFLEKPKFTLQMFVSYREMTSSNTTAPSKSNHLKRRNDLVKRLVWSIVQPRAASWCRLSVSGLDGAIQVFRGSYDVPHFTVVTTIILTSMCIRIIIYLLFTLSFSASFLGV